MNIYGKLVAAKRDIGAIGKDSVNQAQRFNFRGIDDVYNNLHGILAKHGIVTVPTVIEVQRQERTTKTGGTLLYSILTMKYTFYAEDGSSVEATVVGEGMDSGDKASNKAMAVAHKYALLQVFMVPTVDMPDPDADTYEVTERPLEEPPAEEKKKRPPQKPANPVQLTEIQALIKKGLLAGRTEVWVKNNAGRMTESHAKSIIAEGKKNAMEADSK